MERDGEEPVQGRDGRCLSKVISQRQLKSFGFEVDIEEAKTTVEVVFGHGMDAEDEKSATIVGYENN